MKTKLNILKFFPTFSLSFPHRPLSLSLSFCCFSSCFRSCWNRQLWKTAISTIFRPPTEIDENEIDVDSWAKGDGGWGKGGVYVDAVGAAFLAKKRGLAKGMGKAFSRYFTQIPWENIGPLSATGAAVIKS